MSALTILQQACRGLNISVPSSLTGLSVVQDRMLRQHDLGSRSFAEAFPYSWLTDYTAFSTWPSAKGDSATVTSAGLVTISGATPFSTTYSINGRIKIGSTGEWFVGSATSTSTFQIESGTWIDGAVTTATTWKYVQDLYTLTASKILGARLFGTGGSSTSHTILSRVDSYDIEDEASNGDMESNIPVVYAITARSGTTVTIRLYPPPEFSHVVECMAVERSNAQYATSPTDLQSPSYYDQLFSDLLVPWYHMSQRTERRSPGPTIAAAIEAETDIWTSRLRALDREMTMFEGQITPMASLT